MLTCRVREMLFHHRGAGRAGVCAVCAPFRFGDFLVPPKRSLDGAPPFSSVRAVRTLKKRFDPPLLFVGKLLILLDRLGF